MNRILSASLLACISLLTLAASRAGAVSHESECGRLLTEEQFSEAAACYAALARDRPGDAAVFSQWARALAGMQDFETAAERAQHAIALADSARYHVAYGEILFRWAGTGSMFDALGRAREGRTECERAIQLDPRNERARLNLFYFHIRAPGIAGGDRERARALAREIHEIAPGGVTSCLVDAHLLLADDNIAGAESLLVVCGPHCRTTDDSLAVGTVYNQIGYRHLGAKNCRLAIASLRNYLAWVPRGGNPHDSLGDAYSACGERDLAIAEYEQAASLEARFEKISGEKARKLRDKP